MSEILVIEADQGKTLDAHLGDLIIIRLAESPTTGYRWEFSGGDSQLIEFQGSDFVLAPGAGIGGGGTRTFRFRAKSSGMVQIQLKLRRSWEPEARAIEQFTVNIRIQ